MGGVSVAAPLHFLMFQIVSTISFFSKMIFSAFLVRRKAEGYRKCVWCALCLARTEPCDVCFEGNVRCVAQGMFASIKVVIKSLN